VIGIIALLIRDPVAAPLSRARGKRRHAQVASRRLRSMAQAAHFAMPPSIRG